MKNSLRTKKAKIEKQTKVIWLMNKSLNLRSKKNLKIEIRIHNR